MWIAILVIGSLFSTLGYKPIEVIQIAQIANGILLPIIVVFLVYLCNQKSLLGTFSNKWWQNAFALIVVLLSIVISVRSMNSVFGFLS